MQQPAVTPSSAAPQLVLASQSATRQRLLQAMGYAFTAQPADVDETPLKNETPRAYVQRISAAKARAVHAPGQVTLAADTPVIVGRRILQTPQTVAEARAMLAAQRGRRVHIPTVVTVMNAQGVLRQRYVESWVKFRPFQPAEMDILLADEANWRGASGALKLGRPAAEVLIATLHGSTTGIEGLPMAETAQLLHWAGLPFGRNRG